MKEFIGSILLILFMLWAVTLLLVNGWIHSFKKKVAIFIAVTVCTLLPLAYLGNAYTLYVAYFGTPAEFSALQADQLAAVLKQNPENDEVALQYYSEVSHSQSGRLDEAQRQAIMSYWWRNQNPAYLNLLAVDAFQNQNYTMARDLWRVIKNIQNSMALTPIDLALTKVEPLINNENRTTTVYSVNLPKGDTSYTLYVAARSALRPKIPAAVKKVTLTPNLNTYNLDLNVMQNMQGELVTLTGMSIVKYQFLSPDAKLGDTPIGEGYLLVQGQDQG